MYIGKLLKEWEYQATFHTLLKTTQKLLKSC